MRPIAVLCAAVCGLNLAGCVVHDHKGPTVKIPVPVSVSVPAEKPCPPGQAKKANC
jgi:hypothetical protein